MKKSYSAPLFESKEIKVVAILGSLSVIDAGGDVGTDVGNEQP